jgi:hypothetical protein
MTHSTSEIMNQAAMSSKIRADLAIKAAYIVAMESAEHTVHAHAKNQWQAAQSVRSAYSQEDLEQCIDLVRSGALQIEPVIFDHEPVIMAIAQSDSPSFKSGTISMPCWITEENLLKIESVGGPFILAMETVDHGSSSNFIAEIYKCNLPLETHDLTNSDSFDEMGCYQRVKVFTSIDSPDDSSEAFLQYLHCTNFFLFFQEVRVRSIVSLHDAARRGDFAKVPTETMTSYLYWHGEYRDGAIWYDEAYCNSPFHLAAHAGHFDKIPSSIMSAAGLLKTGMVDKEFALLHSEFIELEWVEYLDHDAPDFRAKYEMSFTLAEEWHKNNSGSAPDFEEQAGVPKIRKLHCAYACPIVLALLHGQTDQVVEAIQSIPASEWVKTNQWAHTPLAGIAKKTGIEHRISNLLAEVDQLTPPPFEQEERDTPFPEDWDDC